MSKGKIFGVFQFIYLIIIIFIGLQLLNQFLIITGNKIFSLLQMTTGYEVFIVGIFQQSIQIITAIILSKMVLKKGVPDIGLNFWNFRKSIKYFAIFALSILTIYFIYINIARLYFPNLWNDMQFAPIPSNQEIFTKLLFQSIFPGLGEELLFRGFLISLLITKLNPELNKFYNKLFISIVSGLFFAIAHIYFDISSFQITHIDLTQFLLALFCGVCYSLMFINTKSLIGPIFAHNFSNVSSTIIGLLIAKM
jgi:membrane protease YdiL (CAAX protease family)